ncbi:unnamed protein product [Prorocentrum cordatum]|uniref:Cilia- and flagella-associated protein 157 n=1 Tax=Prorocentrum cordatum TaxID=2364126 RepID=A0ABN9V367_9DINO|nr:unnamed protein product [Polarella glacialis]
MHSASFPPLPGAAAASALQPAPLVARLPGDAVAGGGRPSGASFHSSAGRFVEDLVERLTRIHAEEVGALRQENEDLRAELRAELERVTAGFRQENEDLRAELARVAAAGRQESGLLRAELARVTALGEQESDELRAELARVTGITNGYLAREKQLHDMLQQLTVTYTEATARLVRQPSSRPPSPKTWAESQANLSEIQHLLRQQADDMWRRQALQEVRQQDAEAHLLSAVRQQETDAHLLQAATKVRPARGRPESPADLGCAAGPGSPGQLRMARQFGESPPVQTLFRDAAIHDRSTTVGPTPSATRSSPWT